MEALSNFSFLCEVSIWLCLIVWLCQILDAVRLRPTFDVVRSSMNLIQGEVRFWKTDFVKGQFCPSFRNYTISGSICWVLRFKTITYPASENCPQMCSQLNCGCHQIERNAETFFFLLCRSFKFSSLKLLFSEPNLSTLF